MISRLFALVLVAIWLPLVSSAQFIRPEETAGFRWRCIGPFRGGRTVAAVGIPGHPNEFLIGVNNGGVWKSTDYGRVWRPIFDQESTGSIGAIGIAPSNPKVIYVGSGEGLQRPDLSVGNGVYRSEDGGITWTHQALRFAQQIAAIAVDPRDPNRLFVAAVGHPYGPNPDRGIFVSTDGGRSFQRSLWIDENTGATAVAFDPKNPNVLYADMWAARQGPWENGAFSGKTHGLYKSTDDGKTWRRLITGLPQDHGRIGFSVSNSNPNRLYATVDSNTAGGIYRSEDAGETWTRVNKEPRLWGRGDDFAEVRCDPANPDRVYVANTSMYRSDDGGATFACIKGSPGGDDYHTIWIQPENPNVILLAGDQGAAVSVNGGETWSSWYNQPTAQFYHVATDNAFPYRVYGAQQESGSACVPSRGRYGRVDFRDWYPVGDEEYSYIAPDPLNPDLVYSSKVRRFSHSNRELEMVPPPSLGKYRHLRTTPLMFMPADPKTLLFGTNVLFKTSDGAKTWEIISPDLSREKPDLPSTIGIFKTAAIEKIARRGVIYALGPSYRDRNIIWAGTDDGLIHLTTDGGKTWKDVTPPEMTPWSKISQIDAGHFDSKTAYVSVNRIRLDDQRPYIYRTHDLGKTWTLVTEGLPDEPVNTVREDPVRPGLLYAGTECAVYWSIDDGHHWQSLRQNMPASSIRDLVVKNADLVVATHGRSFWILDDISPLRQMKSLEVGATLFKPEPSYHVVWNANTDTPLPPEEPFGENPPDGSILYYRLPAGAKGPVTLEIRTIQGMVVHRRSSADQPIGVDPKLITVMPGWARPSERLSAEPGLHRYVWDQYTDAPASRRDIGMDAVWNNTPLRPRGKWCEPGEYRVVINVDGRRFEQTLKILPDPRKK